MRQRDQAPEHRARWARPARSRAGTPKPSSRINRMSGMPRITSMKPMASARMREERRDPGSCGPPPAGGPPRGSGSTRRGTSARRPRTPQHVGPRGDELLGVEELVADLGPVRAARDQPDDRHGDEHDGARRRRSTRRRRPPRRTSAAARRPGRRGRGGCGRPGWARRRLRPGPPRSLRGSLLQRRDVAALVQPLLLERGAACRPRAGSPARCSRSRSAPLSVDEEEAELLGLVLLGQHADDGRRRGSRPR